MYSQTYTYICMCQKSCGWLLALASGMQQKAASCMQRSGEISRVQAHYVSRLPCNQPPQSVICVELIVKRTKCPATVSLAVNTKSIRGNNNAQTN